MSVSLAVVLAIQSRVPSECQLIRAMTVNCAKTASVDYTHVGNAAAVRDTVARLSPDVDTATDAIVYAAYESNNDPHAISSDGWNSMGAWQTDEGGSTLDQQYIQWLRHRTESIRLCGNLAKVASGSCHHGTKLVTRRTLVKSAILDSLKDDGIYDADLGQRNKEN